MRKSKTHPIKDALKLQHKTVRKHFKSIKKADDNPITSVLRGQGLKEPKKKNKNWFLK